MLFALATHKKGCLSCLVFLAYLSPYLWAVTTSCDERREREDAAVAARTDSGAELRGEEEMDVLGRDVVGGASVPMVLACFFISEAIEE